MKKINKFAIGVGVLATVAVPIIAIKLTEDNFDFTNDLNKLEAKLKSTKLKDQLNSSVGSKEVGKSVTPAELGFAAPSLSKGVTANYVVKTSYDKTSGIIVVTVTLTKDKETKTKDIAITAKGFDFSTDKNKFENNVSTKMRSYLKLLVKKDEVVTSDQLGIVEPKLSQGVETKYVVETPYNSTTGTIGVSVTLTKNGDSATKLFTVTAKAFDFSDELDKILDIASSKIREVLKTAPVTTTGTTITAEQLGIEKPDLLPDVTISYQVQTAYVPATGKVVVLATLTKDGETATKAFTVTAKTNDFAVDLSKFKDFTSTQPKTELEKVVGIKTKGEYLNPVNLGLGANNPVLSDDTTIAYQVQTPYDSTTGKVVFTVILKNNGETASKDIAITARPFNLVDESLKINDAASSKIRAELKTAPITTTGTPVTAGQLGIVVPTLSPGFKVSYEVQTAYAPATGKVVVLATLTDKDDKTATKAFTVTAKAFDFSNELNKVLDAASSKIRAELKTAPVTTTGTTITAEQLGIEKPDLLPDVTISYQVQTAYVPATGKVVVLATLTKDGETATKAFTVTAKAFDFSSDLTRLYNFTSSNTRSKLRDAVGSKEIGDSASISELGISGPEFSDGVTAKYIVKDAYVDASGASPAHIMISVTLAKDGEESTSKDIKVSASFVLSAQQEVVLGIALGNARTDDGNYHAVSTKTLDDLATSIGTKNAGDTVKLDVLGILPTMINLYGDQILFSLKESGSQITNKFKTFTVAIVFKDANGNVSSQQEISITPKSFNFDDDLQMLSGTPSVSTKSKEELKASVGNKQVGDIVSPTELGILDMSLYVPESDTIVVKTPYDDVTGNIVVTATFERKGETSAPTEFTITPKA